MLLGALIGTVMSPCATPALAAALALAGSGSAFGASMWWGAALLLAYGIGHSVLLLVAGAMPGAASALMRRFAAAQRLAAGPAQLCRAAGAGGAVVGGAGRGAGMDRRTRRLNFARRIIRSTNPRLA